MGELLKVDSLQDKFVVLHVVESFGGGVATALEQYRSGTQSLSHHLLRTVRSGAYAGDEEALGFSAIQDLPSQPLLAIHRIRKSVREVRPDVIHAHSSYAGMFVRLALISRGSAPIVYTPHGFSFERTDISSLAKFIFKKAERFLAKKTRVFAACSPREAELCQQLNKESRVVYVPNVAPSINIDPWRKGRPDENLFVVAGAGRITPARDPEFFAEVAKIVGKVDASIKFVWIGGGDPNSAEKLKDAGVTITGWITRESAVHKLSEADLHLHTAAWDGFPLVLLEANQLRIPSLVRNIDAFDSVPSRLKAETVEELAKAIVDLANSKEKRHEHLKTWDEYLEANTAENQARQLMTTYALASGRCLPEGRAASPMSDAAKPASDVVRQ